MSNVKRILRRMLPRSLWRQLSAFKYWINGRIGSKLARLILINLKAEDLQRTVEGAGYCVAGQTDYYSPLPSVSSLRMNRARWDKPSALSGVAFDLAGMKALLLELSQRYAREFAALPPYEQLQKIGFGPGYTAVDALTLYLMIRQVKPRRYIEVGSGLSTYYASLAAAKNAAEGRPMEMTCIEPYPYEKLYSIPNITLVKSEVQSVDPAVFKTLQANDLLFIDSSHILKIDGDVAFLFLEVLPSLARQVVIHVHDVPFPYNNPYPADLWVFGREWPLFWNEAMVLQAFICHNAAFKILLSTPLIRHWDESFLKQHIANYQSVQENPNAFSSLWLEKVG